MAPVVRSSCVIPYGIEVSGRSYKAVRDFRVCPLALPAEIDRLKVNIADTGGTDARKLLVFNGGV